MALVEKIQPDVPVRRMLMDREFRAKATAEQLCFGAAAMHEAAAALAGTQGERVASQLIDIGLAAGD